MANREIKFRAWDKGKKEFVDDVLITANKHGFLYQNDNKCEFSGEDRDIILMQYTGLKDKTGVEIFERDIVRRFDYGERVGVVEYGYGNGNIWGGYMIVSPKHGIIGPSKDIEVIGNIYENPELISSDTK